jgi:hypothetical protein
MKKLELIVHINKCLECPLLRKEASTKHKGVVFYCSRLNCIIENGEQLPEVCPLPEA